MKTCPECDRHLFGAEPACPFCGAEQASIAAQPNDAMLASVALVLTLGAAACGPNVTVPGEESTGTDHAMTTATTVSASSATPPVDDTTMSALTSDGTASVADETTEGSDEVGDAPCGFYAGCSPDGGGVVFECDLFTQDCPAGEKCMPWSNDGGAAWNATRCAPLSPTPRQNGDECSVEGSALSGLDNCDIGLMCWNVEPATGVGVCQDMCTGLADDPVCPDADDVCAQANGGAISLCLPRCDPLAPGCVVDNEACYPVNDDWVCAPDVSGEPGAHGDPCGESTTGFGIAGASGINACDPGHVCVGAAAFSACASTVGCCTAVCDTSSIDADAQCQAMDRGQTCAAWYHQGAAPSGYETVGVCAIPP